MRRAASESLVAIGKASLKPLTAALESENPVIRTAAGQALSRWREMHIGDNVPVATTAEPDPQ